MLFSIIIPVYNIKKSYLEQCMSSILNQTDKDFEVLLVDDGSTNGCGVWCDEYMNQYPELIRVIHKVNEGVSEARNTGMDEAQGQYYIFMDPDDWVEEQMCEWIHSMIEIQDFDILNLSYITEYVNASIVHEKSDEYFVLDSKQKEEAILKMIDTTEKLQYKAFQGEIFGSVWGKCYKASFIKKHNVRFQRPLTKAQDTVFNLEAFKVADTIVDYKKIVYHYRMVSNSITHRYNKKIYGIQSRFLKAVKNFLDTSEYDQRFHEAFAHRVFLSYFSILELDIFNPDNPYKSVEKKRQWQTVRKDAIFKEINSVNTKGYSWKSQMVIYASKYGVFIILKLLYLLRNMKDRNSDGYECYE